MYEFAGAGPCPFPGQLQYRVVNPHGAGVYFEKSFETRLSALRPGQIVCGTPRTDPSGMASYVVELNNGYASALDFEQLTSALPSPVLASGALYQLDYVGAGPCPYPGQLQYRVVNPHGAGVYFEKSFETRLSALRPGQVVCGTPKTDPSGMSSYVVELDNGYASALDFEQLTSALPSPVLVHGFYAGDVSSLNQPGPHGAPPVGGCPVGTYWDDYHGRCAPTMIPSPPPQVPTPLTSGYYTGQGDIQPDIFGVDAILKGCKPGQYWDGWFQKCMATHVPLAPPPVDPFPPTLDEWRKLHRTGGEHVGWDLFHDVFGSKDPFHGRRQEDRWQRHHDIHEEREHGWHDPHEYERLERERREHEHFAGYWGEGWRHPYDPWHREWEQRFFVGAAAAGGDPAATAAVHAENAAVQAKSAGAAADHPTAHGTAAGSHAAQAASHAVQAASHAQAAAAHPSLDGKVAHSDQATAHAQQAASHAAAAHAAIGNHSGAQSAGVEARAGVQHPEAQAASHAQNAAQQAHAAQRAAAHPSARGTGAGRSASVAQAHAAQAQMHARAAMSHRSPQERAVHAQRATMHAHEAASHAVDAHREVRRPGERGARGREGFGRGREGFGRGGFGRRDAYGRFHGRRFHGEWRGFGHPGWRHGVGERWLHHRAECFRRGDWACLAERIYDPSGNICYRITPAGEMEGEQLGQAEQQANIVYVQATGQQPPTNDDGPMPGSDPASDGSKAPADDADAGAADQGQAGTDQGGADQSDGADQDAADQGADQGDDAAAANGGGNGNGNGNGTDQTSGDFAGWDMPFTDPYGYFNMAVAPAWNSAYAYLPPDYWYPGMGYW